MTKSIIAAVMLLSISAMADVTPGSKPMAFRASQDRYAIPGEGYISTVNCTVTAEGLRANVEGGDRPWLWFYDHNGNLEGDCQILTMPRPVVVITHRPIQRGIATIANR